MAGELSPWLPLSAVQEHVTGSAAGEAPAGLERARAAAAGYVEQVRQDLFVTSLVGVDVLVEFVPTPQVLEGAVLLAARWHARRASPAGLATFQEFGPAAVSRLDVDVERLLGVGRYARPAIG